MSQNTTSTNLFGTDTTLVSTNLFEGTSNAPVESVAQGLAMVARGPKVESSEVENDAVNAVEVRIAWGNTILHVAHLTEQRAFTVGEAADFEMPAEKLGAEKVELVSVVDGQMVAKVVPGSRVQIIVQGLGEIELEQAVATGLATVMAEGGYRITLRRGTQVRCERDGLVFQVASVAAGKATKGSLITRAARPAMLMGALSFIAHVGLMAGLAYFKPALENADDEAIRAENEMVMKQFLKAASVREEERRQVESDNAGSNDAGKPGAGASKQSETHNASTTNAKTGSWTKGPTTMIPGGTGTSTMSAREEMMNTGMIAMLAHQGGLLQTSTAWNVDANGPGNDSMFMNPADTGHLSLLGDPNGDQGNDLIRSTGPSSNFSATPGSKVPGGRTIKGDHTPGTLSAATPVPSRKDANVSPELIQRLLRQNRGRFIACYEDGLRRNPSLSGRVTLSFTIGSDGSVKTAGASGDIADSAVTSCMGRAVYGLSFPSTEGGVIRVSYPMVLTPAN
ncbi:MAG: AgmX/PglI C-terminal domain-containing protein [Polyangiaceae bacterium]